MKETRQADRKGMARAGWSGDFGEAQVLVGMLQANAIAAEVFDADLIRMDWFYTMVYGGYRIMVPAADLARARELLAEFRSGAASLPEDELDRPACPHCGSRKVQVDPQPRRLVFLAVILGAGLPLFVFPDSPIAWALAMAFAFVPVALWRWLGSRYRCTACRQRFAVPRRSYRELAAAVEAADHGTGDRHD